MKMISEVGKLNFPRLQDPSYKKGDDFSLRVYTVTDESRHLLIKNVPKTLRLLVETQAFLVKRAGLALEDIAKAEYYQNATYSEDERREGMHEEEAILVSFVGVKEAQRVKMKANRARFYGRELYIQYLPAMDTEEDIKAKFAERVARVSRQIE